MFLCCRFCSRHIGLMAAALSLVQFFPATAVAQTSRVGASVEGIVSDSSAAAIPRSKVTLRNSLTSQSRTVETNAQGSFRAEQLQVGTYEIQVRQPDFAPYRNSIVLSLGGTVHLAIVLSPASVSEKVTVTVQSSGVDVSQTSVVSSVDRERIEELPVRTRNSLDFVLLATGVSSAPPTPAVSGSTPLGTSGFTFGGLRPRSNDISIDGLDNNDEFSGASRTEISPEIVQEFQVVNNGLSAESGGASGGSINVVTRSGTNTIHGDAVIFAQDGAFNAREPFETEPGKPSFRRFRAGASLGGPIIKNRMFYYGAIEQEHNRGQIGSDINPVIATSINNFLATGAFPGLATRHLSTTFSPIARAETEAAAKFDDQLTTNTSLMLRYAFTNNREPGDGFNTSGLMDRSANGSTFISDNGLSGSLTTVLSSQSISDLRFQATTRHAVLRTNQAFGPEIDIAGLAIFGRPYQGNSQRRENHYQAAYSYSRLFGKHLWKCGATVNRVRLQAELPDGFGGVYLFGSLTDFLNANPSQFREAFGNPRVDFPVTSLGAFIQDHWSPARQLTLDLGLRYDFEHLPAPFNQDTNNFSPRIGLAWSPFQKWVFRAGYGIFFDRYILANLARSLDRNGSQAFDQVADGPAAVTIFAIANGGPLSGPTPQIAPSIFRPDARLPTPYSQQASVGSEYLLAKKLTFRADYLFVHGVKLPRTANANLLPTSVLTTANAAALGIPTPTPQQIGREVFSPGRLDRNLDDVYRLQDSSSSTYNGVFLTVSRQMNQELEFSASYTFSKALDDASDFDEQPQNPYDLRAERALSRQNQQQRFVFNALWDLPIGEDQEDQGAGPVKASWASRAFGHIEVAPIFTFGSARPVDPLTGVDSNQAHAFPLSARPLGFGRNSLRTPDLATMNFRVLKYFPFGPGRRLDVVAEFFNLFNSANVSDINPVFGSGAVPISAFREPIETSGARQIQFSLDFEF